MEDVGIFYEHLVHFTVFYYILRTFGTIRGNLVYFFPFLVFYTKKNLVTLLCIQQMQESKSVYEKYDTKAFLMKSENKSRCGESDCFVMR
jgi:hypothetical protein